MIKSNELRIYFGLNKLFSVLMLSVIAIGIQLISTFSVEAQGKPAIIAINGAKTIPVYRFYFGAWSVDVYRTVNELPGDGWVGEGVVPKIERNEFLLKLFFSEEVAVPETVRVFALVEPPHDRRRAWIHFR